jgi:hypothetical protein
MQPDPIPLLTSKDVVFSVEKMRDEKGRVLQAPNLLLRSSVIRSGRTRQVAATKSVGWLPCFDQFLKLFSRRTLTRPFARLDGTRARVLYADIV